MPDPQPAKVNGTKSPAAPKPPPPVRPSLGKHREACGHCGRDQAESAGQGEERRRRGACRHEGGQGETCGGGPQTRGKIEVSTKDESEIEASSAPLIEHLMELRTRLMWSIGGFFVAFLVCFFFAKQLFNILVQPFKWAVHWAGLQNHQVELIYTAPQEVLLHAGQARDVRRPGHRLSADRRADLQIRGARPLQERARRLPAVPDRLADPVPDGRRAGLFLLHADGHVVLPVHAAGRPGNDVQISLLPKVSEYLSLIMTLIFSFGLVFQLPVVTTLMARVGLLTSQGLKDKRKWAIVLAFIVAAVLTPPDPMSQIGLAVPTIILYEVSIWAARFVEKSATRKSSPPRRKKRVRPAAMKSGRFAEF